MNKTLPRNTLCTFTWEAVGLERRAGQKGWTEEMDRGCGWPKGMDRRAGQKRWTEDVDGQNGWTEGLEWRDGPGRRRYSLHTVKTVFGPDTAALL